VSELTRWAKVAGPISVLLGLYFLLASNGVVATPASASSVTKVMNTHNDDIAYVMPKLDKLWTDSLCEACIKSCQRGCEMGGGSCSHGQCKEQCREDGEC